MRARTGLWEPRAGNCPGPPGQICPVYVPVYVPRLLSRCGSAVYDAIERLAVQPCPAAEPRIEEFPLEREFPVPRREQRPLHRRRPFPLCCRYRLGHHEFGHDVCRHVEEALARADVCRPSGGGSRSGRGSRDVAVVPLSTGGRRTGFGRHWGIATLCHQPPDNLATRATNRLIYLCEIGTINGQGRPVGGSEGNGQMEV